MAPNPNKDDEMSSKTNTSLSLNHDRLELYPIPSVSSLKIDQTPHADVHVQDTEKKEIQRFSFTSLLSRSLYQSNPKTNCHTRDGEDDKDASESEQSDDVGEGKTNNTAK